MLNEEIIDLGFQIENLPKDAFNGIRIIVIGMSTPEMPQYPSEIEIGRTEKRYETDVVSFKDVIRVLFKFGISEMYKVYMCIYQSDSDDIAWNTGEIPISIFQILRQNGTYRTILPFPGYSLNSAPILTVSAQVSDAMKPCTYFQFVGHHLLSRNSYPLQTYFSLWLYPKVGLPILLYRSEIIDSKNPKWKGFILPNKLFGTSSDGILRITCHNMNNNAPDTEIGYFSTTFYQLLKGIGPINKYILHYNTYEKKKEDMSMELVMIRKVDSSISIPSLIASGVQLHFTLAIDFTTHNGSPNEIDSLHSAHPMNNSIYGKRLSQITREFKLLDLKTSLFGFGAKISNPNYNTMELSQCFALNDDIVNPFCESPDQIQSLYRRKVINSLFYAPTNYAQIVANVRKQAIAASRSNRPIYFVLIILTRGHLVDNKAAKDSIEEITKCSKYPISIVFLGVGNNKYPIRNEPESIFSKIFEQRLKTMDNFVQEKENVSFIDTTSDASLPILTQTIFSNVARQMILHEFKKSNL